MVLNMLLTPPFGKGKETFEKVLLKKVKRLLKRSFVLQRREVNKYQSPADVPRDTTSTQITEFHIALVYLHFSTVSFWSDEAKQNETA